MLQAAAEAAGAVDSAPQLRAAVGAAVAKLSAQTKELVDQYVAAMEAIKLRDGIKLAMAVSGKANKFLQVRSRQARAALSPVCRAATKPY